MSPISRRITTGRQQQQRIISLAQSHSTGKNNKHSMKNKKEEELGKETIKNRKNVAKNTEEKRLHNVKNIPEKKITK